jgi:hypothetical protein
LLKCNKRINDIKFFFLIRIPISRIDKNQICGLVIGTSDNGRVGIMDEEDTTTTVCTHVFTVFKNLRYLNMNPSDCVHVGKLLFKNKLSMFFSSTLLELHINLNTLDDCFHLFDGRFSQLRVLNVNIGFICSPSMINSNRVSYFP